MENVKLARNSKVWIINDINMISKYEMCILKKKRKNKEIMCLTSITSSSYLLILIFTVQILKSISEKSVKFTINRSLLIGWWFKRGKNSNQFTYTPLKFLKIIVLCLKMKQQSTIATKIVNNYSLV